MIHTEKLRNQEHPTGFDSSAGASRGTPYDDAEEGGFIYLATPYSDPDPAVMESRFDTACRVAGALMAKGHLVFSPIAHTHPIAVRCELRREWEFWQRYDYAMLMAADRLLVVKMPGWEQSKGVTAEIRIAREMAIPVEYLEWETGQIEAGVRNTAEGAPFPETS